MSTTMTVVSRLEARGLRLPRPPEPGGSYRPAVLAGGLLFLSGQFPLEGPVLGDQRRFRGRLGAELDLEEGRQAARLAALNALARIRAELGGFGRIVQIVRLDGHLLTAPGFVEHPRVLDAASELFEIALAERSGHARTIFGHATLPYELCIELVVTLQVDGDHR